MTQEKIIVVLGAGAAGFFAAINAKEKNPKAKCLLLEGSRRVLTKVKISGGGRCNVTHNLFDPKLLVQNYPRGFKELLSAFYSFQPKDMVSWLEKRGVKLKAEADGRMFPESNKSSTIIDCLSVEAAKLGVDLQLGQKIKSIQKKDELFHLELGDGTVLKVHKLILATGSSPSGYQLAESLGHKIVDPVPSLFTFNIKHPFLKDLPGQSFEKVDLELSFEKSLKLKKYKQQGPLLITHWGLSGPAVLKLSAFAARDLHESSYQAHLKVNFLWQEQTKEEALLVLENYKKENRDKGLGKNFPFSFSKRFWCELLSCLDIQQEKTWQELSKKNLSEIAFFLTEMSFQVDGKGVFKEEFVTAGGVDLKEIDFKTMESRLCSSLYFCGEILNIDGITGGFNFQNAWTTAWLAGNSV